VTFEALCICDGPYHISEYAVEGDGQVEHDRDRGCQMECSRQQGHKQRTLKCAGVD
jgi:hypothetical protein